MADPINGAAAAEEELVDYEEVEEVPEGDAAKGDQVGAEHLMKERTFKISPLNLACFRIMMLRGQTLTQFSSYDAGQERLRGYPLFRLQRFPAQTRAPSCNSGLRF